MGSDGVTIVYSVHTIDEYVNKDCAHCAPAARWEKKGVHVT